MDNTHEYDGLLISYLLRELGAEEKAFVETWIKANDQNQQYFNEMEILWSLIDLKNTDGGIDVDKEWLKYKNRVAAKGMEEPTKQVKVIDMTQTNRYFVRFAIAASVLLVLGLGHSCISYF